MEILIRLDRFNEPLPTGTHKSRSEELFQTVKDIFYDCCGDDEVYLYEGIEDDDCIFGDEQPQAIIRKAEAWNSSIRQEVHRALENLEQARLKNGGEYPADCLTTYEARKALLALDNHFYEFADWATCLGETQGYLKVTIRDEELRDIQAYPERYALIEVQPK